MLVIGDRKPKKVIELTSTELTSGVATSRDLADTRVYVFHFVFFPGWLCPVALVGATFQVHSVELRSSIARESPFYSSFRVGWYDCFCDSPS